MVDGAAPVAAEHAGGVRVVDHHDGAVFFGEIGELRQRADVAIHGEDAVGDEQLVAGLVLDLVQKLFGMRRVLVAEDFDLGAREAGAVDDAGVIQLVGDDEVFLAENRGDGAGIGGEAGLEDHAGFDVLEARNLFFQLHVDRHGAGDGAHRAGADAVLLRGFERGFAQLGVSGQSEIVVGGEVDDLLAVEGADRRLLVLEHAQLEVGAILLQVVELVGEKRERIGASGGRCHRGHPRKSELTFYYAELEVSGCRLRGTQVHSGTLLKRVE